MTMSRDELMTIIIEAGTQMDCSKLTDDAKFEDYGADSLDVMNILLGVQEKTGTEVPDEDIQKITSINSVLDYVNGR